jgi:hypothetical protein
MRGALMTAWAAGRISLVALYGHDPRPLVDALAERPRQELAEAVVLSATSPLYLTPPLISSIWCSVAPHSCISVGVNRNAHTYFDLSATMLVPIYTDGCIIPTALPPLPPPSSNRCCIISISFPK